MSEERFLKAMAAPTPRARDTRFTLAVLERAEAAQTRREGLIAGLRVFGLLIASLSLVPALAGWGGANGGPIQNGVLGALALLTLVGLTRMMGFRLNPAR